MRSRMAHTTRWAVLPLLLFAISTALALPSAGTSRTLLQGDPPALSIISQEVTFGGADIKGLLVRHAFSTNGHAPGIVVVPAFPSEGQTWQDSLDVYKVYAESMVASWHTSAGSYPSVLITSWDHRARGELFNSNDKYKSVQFQDVGSAIMYLKGVPAVDDSNIVVMGFGEGGSAVITTAVTNVNSKKQNNITGIKLCIAIGAGLTTEDRSIMDNYNTPVAGRTSRPFLVTANSPVETKMAEIYDLGSKYDKMTAFYVPGGGFEFFLLTSAGAGWWKDA
mmetsp:Transcript_33847/g.107448  ORF Transcript_33847/g.107448 Transcript_33847/m.107448 type:complete len:279 (-) Transcript_33847:38-874(-)